MRPSKSDCASSSPSAKATDTLEGLTGLHVEDEDLAPEAALEGDSDEERRLAEGLGEVDLASLLAAARSAGLPAHVTHGHELDLARSLLQTVGERREGAAARRGLAVDAKRHVVLVLHGLPGLRVHDDEERQHGGHVLAHDELDVRRARGNGDDLGLDDLPSREETVAVPYS